MQDTFCPVPWNHLSMTNNGDYRVCCDIVDKPWAFLKDASGRNLNAKIDSISKVRNAEVLKELRSAIVAGERHKMCGQCWLREDNGLDSRRQMFSKMYSKMDALARQKTTQSGEISSQDFPIENLDLRFGNKCNLSCRTCQPSNSSLKLQEWARDKKQDHLKFYDQEFPVEYSSTGVSLKGDPFDWNGSEQIFRDIQKIAPQLHQLYITGGEPMISEEHWKMLEHLAESGESRHIHLVYNSNVLFIPEKAEGLWCQFKTVDIACSIDGVGAFAESIRPPTVWSKVEHNLTRLDEMPDTIRYSIAPTISALNIHHLPEIVKWLRESGLKKVSPKIGTHLLFYPEHFSVQVLAKESKVQIRKLFEQHNLSDIFAGVLKHMDDADHSHLVVKLDGHRRPEYALHPEKGTVT